MKATYNRVQYNIKILNELSKEFYTNRCLRQDDALSCLFFNIALEKVIRDAMIATNDTIRNKSIQILTMQAILILLADQNRQSQKLLQLFKLRLSKWD